MNIFGGVNSALLHRCKRERGLTTVVVIVPIVSLFFLFDAAVMVRHDAEHVFTTSCSMINFSLLRELDNIEICKVALRSIENSSREFSHARCAHLALCNSRNQAPILCLAYLTFYYELYLQQGELHKRLHKCLQRLRDENIARSDLRFYDSR